MVRPIAESGAALRRGATGASPLEYEDLLARLGRAAGTALRFEQEGSTSRPERLQSPVRAEGRRTGWLVVTDSAGERARAAVDAASEVISRIMTADQDIASLSMEIADRYEELTFLYEMGDRVSALLGEDQICGFVAEEASWLLDCERASVMILDEDTGLLRIRAAVGMPEGLMGSVAVRPGERISGKVLESGHAMVVNDGDPMPADALRLDSLRESNAFLCAPLRVGEESGREETVIGVINLTGKRRGAMFTSSDLKLVNAIAATTATHIHDCRLLSAERERQRLEQELELAARIQLSLLPKAPLSLDGVQAGGVCRPARHVGGDVFDYWVEGSRLCMLVADVSGHDIGAALMATALRSVVRSEAAHRHSVAGLLAQANRALFDDLLRSELLISAFYAELDMGSGELTFSRAGHPLPLLLQGGRADWLDTDGVLLGLLADSGYEERRSRLVDAAVLVLYTDGLVESVNRVGKQFGTDGLRAATAAAIGRDAGQVASSIVEAARSHSDGIPLRDDMTALVVRLDRSGTREP
jgi:sigma-B regulation protein RsbU (phosphoserine phosphatase)